ncbi:sorting nexin-21 isoform X2 [Oxyura jamaicensis]|uniref:sorting nexin-21 isoform X2 n=1 Tax=Oxyura jamaicensis TaxID=8884 RepID=UPI0015A5F044|nr:sorting nexin-21 isoform X2 [Oxyura jamaicensis]
MAARILHRLRHALGSEGGREERARDGCEAEDCPESSELEDDTEGLSTRLSGTLSFASHEDEEEEEEEEEDGAGEEPGELPEPTGEAVGTEDGEWDPAAKPPGGSLLTRQLQELWRKSRSSLAPQRLLFEVTSASVVSERSSKYVEEAAAQLHGRDHRQAEPSLRAVPVPPALHCRDPPLPRVPRVLLPAGPAGRPAPDLHRHVPRGPGHLGQRVPAAGPAGGLRLRPLPADAGRAGRLPPGAGRARRGAQLLRAGAAAAGGPGQPPAAGALPPGPRPPGLEGGQGQAAVGGPAAGPAGGRAVPAAAAQPEGVPDQGASRVSPLGQRRAQGPQGAARLAHQGGSRGQRGSGGGTETQPTCGGWELPLGNALSVSVLPSAPGARCLHPLPAGEPAAPPRGAS